MEQIKIENFKYFLIQLIALSQHTFSKETFSVKYKNYFHFYAGILIFFILDFLVFFKKNFFGKNETLYF